MPIEVIQAPSTLIEVLGCWNPAYGSFYDTTTQYMASATAEQTMKLNSTDFVKGMNLINGDTIRLDNAGKFSIQFSIQLQKLTGGTVGADIWLRKNGVDVPDTNGSVIVTGGSGTKSRKVISWNWFIDAAATDEYQIMWWSEVTDLELLSLPAVTGVEPPPNRPTTPSVIVTVTQVGI